MMYGGYPRVVLAQTKEKKKARWMRYTGAICERDITDLLGVEKPEAFTNLLKIIASQIGNLVNITELSSTIGISSKTVEHYLWYLEETFILKRLPPIIKIFVRRLQNSYLLFF